MTRRVTGLPVIIPIKREKDGYYNQFFELEQQKINLKFYELCLPDDDPVFTLKILCSFLWECITKTGLQESGISAI